MSLKLYFFPSSHWSRIVTLALAEKGGEAEREIIDIRRNANYEPEYLRINPKGVVPTLVDTGEVVTSARRIVEHLDRILPEARLLCGEADRGWADRFEPLQTMLLSYSVWVQAKKGERSAHILQDKIDRAARYAREYPELRELYERKGAFFTDFAAQLEDPARVATAQAEVEAVLDAASAELDSAKKDWLGGEGPGLGDIMACTLLYRLADLGLLAARHGGEETLGVYMQRWSLRESYRRVFIEDPKLIS